MADPTLDPALGRTDAVAAGIRARIAGRQLAPGARIPSVRAFAASMGVSKSTVVEAYERLAAEGAIVARPGSGFYVAGKTRPLVLKALGPELDRAVDPLWLVRHTQQPGSDLMQPGSGLLPASWLPEAAVRRGLRGVARAEPGVLTQYDRPYGYAPLRAHIARRVAEKGVAAEPDQVVLADSTTQALDLVCRFLLQPGDAVLVDDPCYFNFLALLRAHRVAVVGVPMTPAGPDLAALDALLARHRPRFYLTNSALQNPTGTSLAPAVAHRVLRLCEAHDTLIVEDEIFGDLEPEPAPRLAGFDGLDRVIQIGGFSKTLTAAARCGWIALRPDWVEPMVDLKLALSLGNGHVAAALAHGLLTDGTYRRALTDLHRRLAAALTGARRALMACGLEPWAEPRGGYFLWMRLPGGRDAAAVARRALARGLVLAPGVVFSPSGGWRDHLRFNAAHCAEPRVMAALREVLASGTVRAARRDRIGVRRTRRTAIRMRQAAREMPTSMRGCARTCRSTGR